MKFNRPTNTSKFKKEYPKTGGKEVIVEYDNVEQALRKFKKKIQNSGLLDDLKKNEFFDKPTNVRKVKKAIAVKREQKRQSLELNPSRGPGSRRK
jgi:small subunit ribosomal protein S21